MPKYQIVREERSYIDGDFTEYSLCVVTKDAQGQKHYRPTGLRADSLEEMRAAAEGIAKALKKAVLPR